MRIKQHITEDLCGLTVAMLRTKYDTVAFHLRGLQVILALKNRMMQSAVYFESESVLQEL